MCVRLFHIRVNLGWAPWGAIQKKGYAGKCTQRTVFFSKRRKNSSLCAEHPAAWILWRSTGNYVVSAYPRYASKLYGTKVRREFEGRFWSSQIGSRDVVPVILEWCWNMDLVPWSPGNNTEQRQGCIQFHLVLHLVWLSCTLIREYEALYVCSWLIALHHLMECPVEDIEWRYGMILMCRREHIGCLVSTGPAMMLC